VNDKLPWRISKRELVIKICQRPLYSCTRIVARLIHIMRLRMQGVRISWFVDCYGYPIVTMTNGSSIEIKPGSVLYSKCKATALGVNHPVILRTLKNGARIVIGHHVGMSGVSICAAQSIVIEDNCLLGANVIIADTDFHAVGYEERRYSRNWDEIPSESIVIGKNVFIGACSIILKGVHLGDNCIIGAGSVVTCSVPAFSIFAGNPARKVGEVKPT